MSYRKMNRIGLFATIAVLCAIAMVQGCSSSGGDQVTPTAGTGGKVSSSGAGGASTSTAGKTSTGKGGSGTTTGGSSTSNGGTDSSMAGAMTMGTAGEGGAPPGTNACEPAEDHGEAAMLAANNGKLPTL